MTKTAFLLLLLFWQAPPAENGQPDPPTPQKQFFQHQRPVTISATQSATQACAELDSTLYAHAAPALKDLRLYQQDPQHPSELGREIPFAVTLSETAQADSEPATLLNLGTRGNAIVFDLQMPPRPYTDLTLDLDARNFLATATVTGRSDLHAGPSTQLGDFTLFDLTAQHLARSTTIALQESSFRYLHITLTLSSAPGSPALRLSPQLVRAAQVPPSREAQTIYTTVATATATPSGRTSTASFTIPTRVPIERLSIDLPPSFKANFSRDLRITAQAIAQPHSISQPEAASHSDQQPADETISGTIFRVHTIQANREIKNQQLSLPATIGANLQTPARLLLQIQNGDDPPLPISAIRLEMRQRKLCFDSTNATTNAPPLALLYGDPALAAPVYEYERLFTPSNHPAVARLGLESPNPIFHPRQDTRSFAQRHPELLWVALIAVVATLALVAYRSAGTIHR